MNTGKKFEANFKASVPKDYYYLRLNDPAVGFSGGDSRFSPHNPYDNMVFTGNDMFCFELKSKDGAITFWSTQIEIDGKKHTFEIKKHQILGLTKASEFHNVHAGLVINFRNVDRTFYIPICKFNDFVSESDKKSMNWKDAEEIGIEVEVKHLKVNERYDIKKLCEEVIAHDW